MHSQSSGRGLIDGQKGKVGPGWAGFNVLSKPETPLDGGPNCFGEIYVYNPLNFEITNISLKSQILPCLDKKFI